MQKLIPDGVKLVAVSKFHTVESLREVYDVGQRVFGESRVQELMEKQKVMPSDVEWHFIGHLQPNKVKYIAPFVSLIHAVDTPKLLAEIDKQGRKHNRRIPCLLQLHVAVEESKFGFSLDEARDFMSSGIWRKWDHARLDGVMCMASNTDDRAQLHSEFACAHAFFAEARAKWFSDDSYFNICSWGMSHDFDIAVAEGSNMVRIGTSIFGLREY